MLGAFPVRAGPNGGIYDAGGCVLSEKPRGDDQFTSNALDPGIGSLEEGPGIPGRADGRADEYKPGAGANTVPEQQNSRLTTSTNEAGMNPLPLLLSCSCGTPSHQTAIMW